MRKLFLSSLFVLMTLMAWAAGWTHSGEVWTSSEKVEVTIPTALSLKVATSSEGNLTAENDSLTIVLIPLESAIDYETFAKGAISEMAGTFKDAKWSDTREATADGVTVKLREGRVKNQNGVALEIDVVQFIHARRRLGMLTMQGDGDKAASELISKVVGTITFK